MGFFTANELAKAKIKEDPELLYSDCKKCKLNDDKENVKLEVSGFGKKKILLVGEYPTSEEVLYGNAFIGEDGFIITK